MQKGSWELSCLQAQSCKFDKTYYTGKSVFMHITLVLACRTHNVVHTPMHTSAITSHTHKSVTRVYTLVKDKIKHYQWLTQLYNNTCCFYMTHMVHSKCSTKLHKYERKKDASYILTCLIYILTCWRGHTHTRTHTHTLDTSPVPVDNRETQGNIKCKTTRNWKPMVTSTA